MTSILVTSQELVPIAPTLAGEPVTPDLISIVPWGTDVADATFTTPATLDGGPAVWVKNLAAGTYVVLCKMNLQTDQQQPVWKLTGTIQVIPKA